MVYRACRMKKIIHIINSVDLGGTETTLWRLLKALHEHYQFYVIVLTGKGYYTPEIENLGIPTFYLDIHNRPWSAGFKLIKLIKKIKPDIVQTWLYYADFIGGICAKLCNTPIIIWSIRCEGIGLKNKAKWLKKICALLSKVIPNHIITNSKVALHRHIRAGYQAQKMQIIYNGYDDNELTPQHQHTVRQFGEIQLPADAIVIGTLARFHPDKDYLSLIKIIDSLCQTRPHVYVVLCGPGCHVKNSELMLWLQTVVCRNQVILLDGVQQPALYLRQLDIFIQSSRTESFSNSLAEALLCGLACVATDVGETKDLCADNAMIVPAENPNELARACLQMLEKTQQERIKLGLRSRDHIKQCYAWERHQTQMQQLYDRT